MRTPRPSLNRKRRARKIAKREHIGGDMRSGRAYREGWPSIMSTKGIIGMGITSAAFAAFVIYANVALVNLFDDLDAADAANAKCETSVVDLGRKLRRAVSERDFAVRRADDAERMMWAAAAKSTDEAFKRLQAQDSAKAMQTERDRLRASLAGLRAAAIETGSIGKVEPEKPATVPQKRRKRQAVRKAEDPHDWLLRMMPRP